MKRLLAFIVCLTLFCSVAIANSYYPIWSCKTDQKLVALTFDDGPKPEFSLPILEILDRYSVKATFFVVGRSAKMHPDIIYRMASTGHDVASHTYSHTRLDELEPARINKELNLTNQVLKSITGEVPKFFRPPGGRYNDAVLQGVNKNGLMMINWSVNAADYTLPGLIPKVDKDRSWQRIVRRVVTKSGSGDIILMHNGGTGTQTALPKIIEELRQKGYRFVTVSELLGYKTLYTDKSFVSIN